MACQKPSAPSAIASSGPITSPRRFRSSSSPFQDCAFSRTPSVRPTSSLLPSAPSGGQVTDIELGAFLGGPASPEHEALLRLIGASIFNPRGAEADNEPL